MEDKDALNEEVPVPKVKPKGEGPIMEIQKMMQTNPTGLVLLQMKRGVSAFYWTNKEDPIQKHVLNLISGTCAQAIHRKILTKEQIIGLIQSTDFDKIGIREVPVKPPAAPSHGEKEKPELQ